MFPARFIRLIAVLVAVVGFSMSLGGNQASAQEFGICHATHSEGNQYVFIGPDDQSFAMHLANHFGPGGGDRFATEAEFDAGECFNDEEQPTEVPPTEVPPTEVPPTEVPPTDVPPTDVPATTVPGEPTATTAPNQPAPTTAPVQALPVTGANPSDGNDGGMLMIVGAIAVLLFSGATWATTRSRR
jgi:cell division septation protein DedD